MATTPRKSSSYSSTQAEKLYIEKLKRANPSPQVQRVIKEIEREQHSSTGNRNRKATA